MTKPITVQGEVARRKQNALAETVGSALVTQDKGKGLARRKQNALVTQDKGKGLARRKQNALAELTTVGSALVTNCLNDSVTSLADASEFEHEFIDMHDMDVPGDDIMERERKITEFAHWLPMAGNLHEACLPNLARARAAKEYLINLLSPEKEMRVTRADAAAMLHYLFRSITGKSAGENASTKLFACADVFSEVNNVLGEILRMWNPVSAHPLVLALAIKKLQAAKIHEPVESELREALADVQRIIKRMGRNLESWIQKLDRTDELLFEFDRAAWASAYFDLGDDIAGDVVAAMLKEIGCWAGRDSPRGRTLSALVKQIHTTAIADDGDVVTCKLIDSSSPKPFAVYFSTNGSSSAEFFVTEADASQRHHAMIKERLDAKPKVAACTTKAPTKRTPNPKGEPKEESKGEEARSDS